MPNTIKLLAVNKPVRNNKPAAATDTIQIKL